MTKIYSDVNFRHMYSKIYTMITRIDGEEDSSHDLEILSQNIEILYKAITSSTADSDSEKSAVKGVRKLYDHVNLDISRINYLKGQAENVEQKLQKIDEQTEVIKEKVSEALEKAQSIQREYVAMLGIFAAIVVSFFSGISFSSSVLANMHIVSPYRLVFVVIMLALVLFDVLAVLINFVRDMVSTKEKHRTLFIGVNLVFLAILIGDFCAWKWFG